MEKKSRCELALEAAEAGTWLIDMKSNRIDFDGSLRKLLDIEEEEMDLDEAIDSLVHNGDKCRVREEIRRAIHDDGEYDLDVRIIHKSGGLRHVHAKGKVIYDEKGEPEVILGLCIDFSVRKRTQEQLNGFVEREMNLINNKIEKMLNGY